LKRKLKNIYNSSKEIFKNYKHFKTVYIIKSKNFKKVRRIPSTKFTFGWLLEVPPMSSFFTTLLPQETPL